MKKQFIKSYSEEEARIFAPWATTIVKVENGFMAFASKDDHFKWSIEPSIDDRMRALEDMSRKNFIMLTNIENTHYELQERLLWIEKKIGSIWKNSLKAKAKTKTKTKTKKANAEIKVVGNVPRCTSGVR